MIVVQVADFISTKYGGVERWLVAVCRELAKRGHEPSCYFREKPWSGQFWEDLLGTGARVEVVGNGKGSIRYCASLWRQFRRVKPAIVHAHFPESWAPSLLAARLSGALPVYTVHSGMSKETVTAARCRMSGRIRNALAAQVIAVSKSVASQWIQRCSPSSRPSVQYLGIDCSHTSRSREDVRAEFGWGPEDVVVGCVAWHGPEKGVDLFVRAIHVASERCPRVRGVQIGGDLDPDCRTALMNLATELGMKDRIAWLGLRNDVSDLMMGFDVYCQPSRIEGLGLCLLEAMVAEIPVVATRVGCIPEVVGHEVTGLLTQPENVEELADAIVKLAESRLFRKELGSKGRDVVMSRFELGRCVGETIDHYESWHAGSEPNQTDCELRSGIV